MTTDVKFFSSEMAGAPVVSGTKGSLLSMIDACLVTGFGLQAASTVTVVGGIATVALNAGNFMLHSIVLVAGATPAGLNGEKRVLAVTGANTFTFDATGIADGVATGTITVKVAALGWLKPFSGTDTGAYKIDPALHPDTTGCLVRIADTGAYTAGICGYESMSDIDTGAGQFPTTGQVARLALFRSENAHPSTTARRWFLIGDSRFVYLGLSHQDNGATGSPFGWTGFGEFKSKKSADPFRFIVCANFPSDTTTALTSAYTLTSPGNTAYIWLPRSSLGLGGAIKSYTYSWGMQLGASMFSGGGGNSLPYPNGADYGLYLCPVQIFEQSPITLRGEYPGMYFIPQTTGGKITPTFTTAYFDTEVPGFAGKVVGFLPAGEAVNTNGCVAFDLTGPWEH